MEMKLKNNLVWVNLDVLTAVLSNFCKMMEWGAHIKKSELFAYPSIIFFPLWIFYDFYLNLVEPWKKIWEYKFCCKNENKWIQFQIDYCFLLWQIKSFPNRKRSGKHQGNLYYSSTIFLTDILSICYLGVCMTIFFFECRLQQMVQVGLWTLWNPY